MKIFGIHKSETDVAGGASRVVQGENSVHPPLHRDQGENAEQEGDLEEEGESDCWEGDPTNFDWNEPY